MWWCSDARAWTCTGTTSWRPCASRAWAGAASTSRRRRFNATLAGLTALGAWLAEFGVTLVGMEATGVYWKTVF